MRVRCAGASAGVCIASARAVPRASSSTTRSAAPGKRAVQPEPTTRTARYTRSGQSTYGRACAASHTQTVDARRPSVDGSRRAVTWIRCVVYADSSMVQPEPRAGENRNGPAGVRSTSRVLTHRARRAGAATGKETALSVGNGMSLDGDPVSEVTWKSRARYEPVSGQCGHSCDGALAASRRVARGQRRASPSRSMGRLFRSRHVSRQVWKLDGVRARCCFLANAQTDP